MPLWTAFDNRIVEFNADASAHTNNHPLTVYRFQSFFKVGNYVIGNESNSFFSSYQCLKLCPFGFEFFLLCYLLCFGYFLKFRIDVRLFILVKFNFSETTFVEDWNSGSIINCLLDIVDADVIPKNSNSIAIR